GVGDAAAGDPLVGLDERAVDVLARPAEEVGVLEGDGLGDRALHGEGGVAPDGDGGLRVGGGGAAALGPAPFALAVAAALGVEVAADPAEAGGAGVGGVPDVHGLEVGAVGVGVAGALDDAEQAAVRSEEHTSELQSREKLVCRLLLEKK